MIQHLIVPGPLEDVEEFRVLEWHGSEGDAFAAGRLIVELETQKAIVEVRTQLPRVLRRILCPAGDWQKLGRPIAILSDTPDEPIPDPLPADLPALLVAFDVA